MNFTDLTLTEIAQRSKGKPLVVVVSATWCGPCKTLKPKLEDVAAKAKVEVFLVDLDEDGTIAGNKALDAPLLMVPTALFLSGGVEVDRLSPCSQPLALTQWARRMLRSTLA